jgi:hypothetical protein
MIEKFARAIFYTADVGAQTTYSGRGGEMRFGRSSRRKDDWR